jgi:hypothetical protein
MKQLLPWRKVAILTGVWEPELEDALSAPRWSEGNDNRNPSVRDGEVDVQKSAKWYTISLRRQGISLVGFSMGVGRIVHDPEARNGVNDFMDRGGKIRKHR